MIKLLHGDCLKRMAELDAESVDMVLADPPYGTTACAWDTVIPFEPMWEQLKRIVKKNAAIVLFGSQPFTSALVMSNPRWFRYCWYWEKEKAGNFQLAKKRAMKRIEEICVFYLSFGKYNPQGMVNINRTIKNNATKNGTMGHLSSVGKRKAYRQSFTGYPHDRINFNNEKGLHESQKPVALMSYLIKTYTNKGDTVLDFTMGSGTTGVACVKTGRSFIGIEKELKYIRISNARINHAKKSRGLLNYMEGMNNP